MVGQKDEVFISTSNINAIFLYQPKVLTDDESTAAAAIKGRPNCEGRSLEPIPYIILALFTLF